MIDIEAIHARWIERRNMNPPNDKYGVRECLNCQSYVELRGPLGSDWGVCTNAVSRFDGRVCFEHSGCEQHKRAATLGREVLRHG